MQNLVLLLWFTLCAEQDIRQRHITNTLTLGGAALALLVLFSTGHTWIGASVAEGGFALALSMALTIPGYLSGRLDASDVKLLAGLALATDRLHLLGTFVGAIATLITWVLVGPLIWARLPRTRRRLQLLEPAASSSPPFSPFLLGGFLLSLFWLG
jgi:prepilin peptidase CpaA